MHLDSIVNLLTSPLELDSEVELDEIQGGVVNQTFKLTDKTRSFAVKWVADDAFSGINRFHQFVLQEQLAHRQIAPMPVWLSDDGRLWVESWCEPKPLPDESAEHVTLLAEVLSTIHQQPITARPLELTERLQHYLKMAQIPSEDPLAQRTSELAKCLQPDTDDSALTLCHNDLALAHILDASTPVIVDWEYAAMGNRYFDVASAIVINNLSETQVTKLCSLYAEASKLNHEHVVENVNQQIEVVKLTNTLWQKALDQTSETQLASPIVY